MVRGRPADRWTIWLGRFAARVSVVGTLAALVVAACSSRYSIHLRTADGNSDGRPDVWRYYDGDGRLVRVESDTNFDGRPDVEESYLHNRLVRRESDRNFDDQVDLIEEFDQDSGQHRQSTVDTDFDGTADLLVLFSDGHPVFSQWADRLAAPPLGAHEVATWTNGRLRPVRNPFSSAARVGTNPPNTDPTSIDANESPFFGAHLVSMAGCNEARAVLKRDCAVRRSSYFALPSPRGPPLLASLSSRT